MKLMFKTMNVYTIYSQSHVSLLNEHFIPSFNRINQESKLFLSVIELPQLCASGVFESDGFKETMAEKLKRIIETIDKEWGNRFLFCDCDIKFYDGFVEDVVQYNDPLIDMYCQDDWGGHKESILLCSGFMLISANDKNKKLFCECLKDFDKYKQEQHALNSLKRMIKYYPLPVTKYFSVCQATGPQQWNGEPFIVPKDMVMHHANWTAGVENKIRMMKYVEEQWISNNK